MSGKGGKRSLEDETLAKANDLCVSEVKRTRELLEESLGKLSVEERKFFTKLFNFPVISSNHQCQICDVDITRSVKVICCDWKKDEKVEMPFVYCLECLRKGKEKHDHKNDHSYYILDKMDFSLFDPDWSAIDEIMLLRGISASGIDNWIEISDQLGLKTAEDWEAEFYSFYYKSQEDPIPRLEEVTTTSREKSAHQGGKSFASF